MSREKHWQELLTELADKPWSEGIQQVLGFIWVHADNFEDAEGAPIRTWIQDIRRLPGFQTAEERLSEEDRAVRKTMLAACASPAEEDFLRAVFALNNATVFLSPKDRRLRDGLEGPEPVCQIGDDVILVPQLQVGDYALDFALLYDPRFGKYEMDLTEVADALDRARAAEDDAALSKCHRDIFQMEQWRYETSRHPAVFAVEIDGHSFHDRTRDQAEHDRSRDRFLMKMGWRVIRFTASEVFRDAAGCVKETLDLVKACQSV